MISKNELQMRKMKIFHVSAKNNSRFNYLGYDTYSDFVVVCETEEEARNIHPETEWDELWEPDEAYAGWIKRSDIPFLSVVEIGTAVPGIASGTIICSSYHAG